MALKIAIVGTAPSSMRLAPYDDPSWEIWGLNTAHTFDGMRWDRWFDLHDAEHLSKALGGKHWDWLRSQPTDKPIYMQQEFADIPAAVAFPKDELVARFGNYFTNSISWMTALAIQDGAEEIGLYGVDMAQDSEYSHQRPSCEYFVGIARGMGIKVHIPDEADLLKCSGLYGFGTDTVFARKLALRRKELEAKIDQFEQQEITARDRKLVHIGALDDLKWVQQWMH